MHAWHFEYIVGPRPQIQSLTEHGYQPTCLRSVTSGLRGTSVNVRGIGVLNKWLKCATETQSLLASTPCWHKCHMITLVITLWYFVFLYLIFLSQQVLYFLLSTLVLTLYIDVVLSLSIKLQWHTLSICHVSPFGYQSINRRLVSADEARRNQCDQISDTWPIYKRKVSYENIYIYNVKTYCQCDIINNLTNHVIVGFANVSSWFKVFYTCQL